MLEPVLMRSLLSIVRPFRFALALAAAIGSAVSSKGATLYGSSGTESGGQLLPYVVGVGGVSPESLELYGVTEGRAVSWLNSDPDFAAAWVATLPEKAHREITNISLGAGTTDLSVLNAALQLTMERWLTLSGGENAERIEFFAGDRGRGRGGENSDRNIALTWINSGYYAESILPDYSSVAAVPEPSAALLGALGALGLLSRRRESKAA